MKRFLKWLFPVAAFLLLLGLTSCGTSGGLEPPQSLEIDIDNQLSWDTVESARSYLVEVKNESGEAVLSKTTRKTSYSLSDLEVGDYEIRVRATGGAQNDQTSAWSEALYFHRDYETGCVYELFNGNTEYRIKRGGSASGTVTIEATYRGKPVTEIGESAFKGNRNVKEIILGENIRTIAENAFYNCSVLESVTIPDGVTSIGDSAFQGCRELKKVNIPAGVASVPAYCFAYCRSLSEISLGENILSIGESAFNGAALTAVRIPDSVKTIGENAFTTAGELTEVVIGKGVVSIGKSAFYDLPKLQKVTFAEGSVLETLGESCFAAIPSLQEITLPETVTDIGARCFYRCEALERVNIPSTVRHVGTYAFNATKLYTNEETDYVYVDSWLVAVKNQELHKTVTKLDLKQGTVGIIDNCFYKAPILEAVQLPDSVRIVGQYAFSGIETLVRFEAGRNLEVLQEGAFANCTGLYVLLLNRSLQEIGAYAFYGCSTLDNNSLDGNSIIPQSVKRIGAYAFMQTMLWGKPENNIIYAGNWVVGFAENAKLGAAELKDSVVGIADNAFFQCGTLTSLKNLSKCAYIGTAAFYECTALETVSLNPRLETVEAYTFYKCKSLFRVSIPTMLRSVGRSAFYGCSNLKTLDFSESAVFASVGDFAFYGCSNLETVTFGENLTGLGRYSFKNCSTLTAVGLPDTVTAVPEHAFANCSALVTLKLGSGVTSIGDKAFYKCAGLSEVVLPDSVRTVGKSAFYKCVSLATLTLGNSLERIGDFAFYNDSGIGSLILPGTLKQVGKYAFKGLNSLTALVIPKEVATVAGNAFYGCSNATFYIEEGADTSEWNRRWNSSNRPVVSGVRLADEGGYAASLTTGEGTVKNGTYLSDQITPIADPTRAGYTFAGWSREDGTQITTGQISGMPAGTLLTAVWVREE